MNKNVFFFFSFLALLTGSLSAKQDHITQAKRLITEEALFLQTNGFRIVGCGGSFIDNINKLELTVEAPLKYDLKQSRALILICLLDWMERVNGDERAKPFLKHHPMGISDFEIRVIIGDFNTTSTKDNPKISFIFSYGEKIVYCFRDQDSMLLEPFLRESFNEAMHLTMQLKN